MRVVEEGSFSKAANRVFRAQPAVSIAIRRLEEELGAPLFDRAQKSPTLTHAGNPPDDRFDIITLLPESFGEVDNLFILLFHPVYPVHRLKKASARARASAPVVREIRRG